MSDQNLLQTLHSVIQQKMQESSEIVIPVKLSRDEWQAILNALEIAGEM